MKYAHHLGTYLLSYLLGGLISNHAGKLKEESFLTDTKDHPDLKNIFLSEIYQMEKDKHCKISLICGI